MRRFSRELNLPFTLHHLTWNDDEGTTAGMRIVNRCTLRPALKADTFPRASAELYMPYTDLDLPAGAQNRMCRKKLIRYVAFPPTNELLRVTWFGNYQPVTLSEVEALQPETRNPKPETRNFKH